MTSRLETLVTLRAEVDRLIQDEVRLRDSTRSLIQNLRLAQGVESATWADEILQSVAVEFEVAVECLAGQSRAKEHLRPRMVAAWIMRKHGLSYAQIGAKLGGRDHATIINACHRVEGDPKLLEIAMSIREQMRAIGGAA